MERITDKLKKLLALAERGCGGEAENARRLLEEHLRKYGIRLKTSAKTIFHAGHSSIGTKKNARLSFKSSYRFLVARAKHLMGQLTVLQRRQST